MKLRYVLVGALFLVSLASQAGVTGKTAGGLSIFLPKLSPKSNEQLGNKRGRTTTTLRDDYNNGSVDEVEEDRAFLTPAELLNGKDNTVNNESDGFIVVGQEAKEVEKENMNLFQWATGVAFKMASNFFPTAKAGEFKDKITAIRGAFNNAIKESSEGVGWDPETRDNLVELMELSSTVGAPQAIEEVKGIPKEDEEAQRSWIDDMTCKCNPIACAI